MARVRELSQIACDSISSEEPMNLIESVPSSDQLVREAKRDHNKYHSSKNF